MTEELAAGLGLPAMLAPLEGTSPVGADLRNDDSAASLYFRLRDARAEARDAERAADRALSADAVTPPEWRTVRQLAVTALTTATKDLEIAAWLTEALLRGEGLAGLTIGARLMDGLVRAFWTEGLFPVADEDGISTRVAPVAGLNGESGDGTLVQPLRKLVFFRRPDGQPISFWEFDASLQLQGEADAKKRQLRIKAGVTPFDDMERDARAAGAAHFAAQRRDLRAAREAWVALSTTLDDAAGRDSPPTGRVRDLLNTMLEAVARYAPEEVAEPEAQEDETVSDTPATEAAPGAPAARKTESRDDMLRELTRIAEYFRRTEPHSPLAYTLDEAVRRGRMTWPELLAEIVPDATARASMLVQLGIKPSQG